MARAAGRDHARTPGGRRADLGGRARSIADRRQDLGNRTMGRLGALLARETALAWGRGGGPLVSVGFYAGVATLLPLAIGPEPQRLAAIAPGAAWVRSEERRVG